MARKVFISFLGTTDYGECRYYKKDNDIETFVSKPMRFIQEAALDYLEKDEKWTSEDIALILLTSVAEKVNWNDDGHKDRNTHEILKRKGLYNCLKERDSLIQIKTIPNLVMGEGEKDLWTIFSTIFNEINSNYKGCELYFDLTHSFRYLPMLFLVLANYLKFMSEVEVKGIFYGNYESRDKETNKAPILDLLPISNLQDWTYAAASYMNNGFADRLCELAEKEIRNEKKINTNSRKNPSVNALQLFMKYLRDNSLSHLLCRGNLILKGDFIEGMNRNRNIIDFNDYSIPALEEVVKRIYDSMDTYSLEKDKAANNLIEAAYWCYNHKMYQQSVTLLQEGIVSYICLLNGLKVDDEVQRTCVNTAFRYANMLDVEPRKRALPKVTDFSILEEISMECLKKHVPDLLAKYGKNNEFNVRTILKLLDLPIITDLANEFESCRITRNDMNHAGFNDKESPSTPKNIIQLTGEIIQKCRSYICSRSADNIDLKKDNSNVFLNLSNHPSTNWSEEQLAAACECGEIQDLPFPNIDENLDEAGIDALTDEYLEKIRELTGGEPCTVHIMGEMTFTYVLVNKLKAEGYTCVASTSWRDVEIQPDGSKQTRFHFCRFRKY